MKRLILVWVMGMVTAANVLMASPVPAPIPHTPYNRVHRYIFSQYEQIHKLVKAKKLTKDQAQALIKQIQTIQTQERGFVKGNGSKTLTDSQASTLTSQLAEISKSIPRK